MKALKISSAMILLLIALASSGCKKTTGTTTTADDAADAIQASFSTSSGGTAEDVSSAAKYAMNSGYGKTDGINQLQCGVAFDTTITYTYSGAGSGTASYTHSWDILLSCNGVSPSSLQWTGSYQGSFDAARLSGTNSGTRNFTLTGLQPSAAQYIVNGTTSRNGTNTSKVRNQYSYTADITSTLTNLTVDKSTYKITGGSCAVTAVLTVSSGSSQTFNGNIVFNGNGTATLTINGNTYTLTLY